MTDQHDRAAEMAHDEWVMDTAVEEAARKVREACAGIARLSPGRDNAGGYIAMEIRALDIKKLLEGE